MSIYTHHVRHLLAKMSLVDELRDTMQKARLRLNELNKLNFELANERDALIQERDDLIQERDELAQENTELQVKVIE